MPEPYYIICSQSCIVDKDTNLLSLVNLIEGMQTSVQRITPPHTGKKSDEPVHILAQPMEFFAVSVWRRSAKDNPDWQYEFEIGMQRPEDAKEQIAAVGSFKFEKGAHRLMVKCTILPRPDAKGGTFRIESRIRRQGTKSWLRQEYSFPIEVVELESPPPIAANGKKPKKRK